MRGPRTVMKSGPRLPQLEKALAQKRRPNIAINQTTNQSIFKKKKKSACQRRGHGFEPWSGKIPHAVEQLSTCATATESTL